MDGRYPPYGRGKMLSCLQDLSFHYLILYGCHETKVKKKKALEVLQYYYCDLDDVSAVHRIKEHNNEHMIAKPCH
jgi:hypothetical protein